MKKFLILITICLFCFGCSNNQKNITINIYNNESSEEIEKDIKDELNKMEENNLKENNQTYKENENTNIFNAIKIEEDSEITQKSESKIEQVKTWYDENKNELKDINKEIIEEDKNTINDLVDITKNWYDENKDNIKQSVTDSYNYDKDSIIDLYNKLKK